MATGGSLYDDPELYELAFSYRDVASEADVLEAWYQRRNGRPPRRVLELAAGPAAHAIEFASRECKATAVDLSPTMCEHARRRAAQAGVDLDVVEADMVALPIGRRRFDLVVTLLDSASHILDLDGMVMHLRGVGAHLSAGGLYVMETSHPADFLAGAPKTQDRWRLRHGTTRVDVRFSAPPTAFDPATQVSTCRVSVRMSDGRGQRVVRDRIALRRWTATEIDAAARLAGNVEVIERHGSFDVDGPFGIGDPSEWRMISVLQRSSGAG